MVLREVFSPVEEARFFYNALEIKEEFHIALLPSANNPIVQQLAEDLPASSTCSGEDRRFDISEVYISVELRGLRDSRGPTVLVYWSK